MRADLGHQEDAIASIRDRPPHSPLAFAVVVFPGVVEEVDAGVQRLVNDSDRGRGRSGLAEVIAAESHDGHRIRCPSERPAGNEFLSHEASSLMACKEQTSQSVDDAIAPIALMTRE